LGFSPTLHLLLQAKYAAGPEKTIKVGHLIVFKAENYSAEDYTKKVSDFNVARIGEDV